MKKSYFLAVAITAMVFGTSAATYYPITINYAPETALADFPVLVRIPAGSGIYQTAGEGGANLRFTDSLGINNYPHEVDTWNDSGESLVWVKIPELKKDATFRLYCSGEDTTAAKDIWSAYAGVWHLNEAKDSAEKDLDPAAAEPTHTTTVWGDKVATAVIGSGYGRTAADVGPTFGSKVYDDRNGHKCPIQVSNPSRFTVSGWFNLADSKCAWKLLFGEIHQTGGNTGWCTMLSADNAEKMELRQCGGQGDQLIRLQNLKFSGWTKFDVIYDYASIALYTNGVLFSKSNVSSAKNPVWYWTGWLGWGGCVSSAGEAVASGASGTQFDECRLYDGVKTSDRIAADYAVVKDSAFLTIGPATEEQEIPPGTVAQVGATYYQNFAEAVAASKASGDFIILMANGQSWTFTAEGEALDIKVSGMDFTPNNGLGDGFYIDEALDSATEVTTFTLRKQVKVAAMRNVAVYKQLYTRDLADLLPKQVAGLAADGTVVDGMFDVVWDVEDITKYDYFGVTQVPGLATVGGEKWPVTAFVRATLDYSDGYRNIAQEAISMVLTAPAIGEYPLINNPADISSSSPAMITNGLAATAYVGNWSTSKGSISNWNSGKSNPYLDVKFGWGEAKRIYRIEVIARTTNNVQLDGITIAADGDEITSSMPTPNAKGSEFVNSQYNHRYDFATPIEAQSVNITMKQGLSSGVSTHMDLDEILIWSDGTPLDKNEPSTSAELVELEMDGKPVKLEPGVTTYLAQGAKEVTLAKGEANVAWTVLPMTDDGMIRIVTMGENGSSMTYKIKTRAGFTLYVR